MKSYLFLFLVTFPVRSFAQTDTSIGLSKTIDESRMGHWSQGDYDIQVGMNDLETSIRKANDGFLNAMATYKFPDSSGAIFYKNSSDRYLLAANQLKNAQQGFNLRKLILYDGPNLNQSNVGNSQVVLKFIKDLFYKGKTVVYYKGERIYTFKIQSINIGETILDQGTETSIYVDDVNNYLFKDSQLYGW